MILVPVAILLCGVLGWASDAEPARPAARSFMAASCTICHTFAPGLSHPVGIPAPSIAGLPLVSGGALDCTTCHAEPSSAREHQRSGAGAGLRLPAERLCITCHSGSLQPGSALAHGVGMSRAHLDPGAPAEFSAGALDRESRTCIGCHDGSAAGAARFRRSLPGASHAVGSWRSEHPIGVRYDGLGNPRQVPQFQPVGALPAQVRLFGGKLGCGTCHSVYSGVEGMRAVPDLRGGLCLSCHIK